MYKEFRAGAGFDGNYVLLTKLVLAYWNVPVRRNERSFLIALTLQLWYHYPCF